MKFLFLISSFLIAANAFAINYDLHDGESVTIQPSQPATVTCTAAANGGVVTPPVPPPIAHLKSYCLNTSQLFISLDSDTSSQEVQIASPTAAACKNALSSIQSWMGDFTHLQVFSFCSGSVLVKVRASADTGDISALQSATASATECQNAL